MLWTLGLYIVLGFTFNVLASMIFAGMSGSAVADAVGLGTVEIEAMRRVDLDTVASRAEAEAQMGAETGIAPFLLQSLDLGERRWRLNLDALEAAMGDVVGFPDVAGHFDGPALFLSGEESSYVLPEHRERIRALFPAARFVRVKGAGHWLHADRPRETEGAVRAFLDA